MFQNSVRIFFPRLLSPSFASVHSSVLLCLVLFFAESASAQVAGQAETPGIAEVITRMVPLFVIVFFIFYFLVIRPQERKLKAQQDMLENLSKGSFVVTTGGVIARVAGVEKDHILLEVANNTRVKFEKSHIVKLYESPAKKSAKKEKTAA